MSLDNIEDLYKLTPVQQGMLLRTLYAPESGAYCDQFVNAFETLDVAVFRRVWQLLLARHSALRTSFLWKDLDEPVQVVHREVDVPLQVEDASHLDAAAREAHLQAFLEADRQRGHQLDQPPLMRLTVIRFGEAGYRVVWSYHHLLLDGWSTGILLRELALLYPAMLRGQSPSLPPAPPFRNYVQWLEAQDLGAAETYWRQILAGATVPTPLAIDRQPGGGTVGSLGRVHTILPPAATAALQTFARQHRLTLSTVVQAAWALTLGRFSGRDDVVFGVTVSGRPPTLAGIEGMVGCFINTLPARVELAPGARVAAWLGTLQTTQLALRQHEHSPLVQVRRWSGLPADRPLFETIVVFESFPHRDEAFEHPIDLSFQRTEYPLVLAVVPGRHGLRLAIGHDDGRIEATAAHRLLRSLETYLAAIQAQPAARLDALPVLDAAARHQLLVEWNAPQPDYDDDGLVHELIAAQAARTPDAVAVVAEGELLTYGALQADANRLGHHLHALGVGPEHLVGVCLERSPELAVSLLAILQAGGAYVPLDPAYPRDRLAFMVADAGIDLVLTLERLRACLPAGPRLLCLDRERTAIAARPAHGLAAGVRPAHPIYVIYTSGSTGRPKGAVLSHGAVSNRLCYDRCELDATVRFQQLSPISFDMLLNQLFSPLTLGGRTVIARAGSEKDPAYLARWIARQGITHAGFPRLLLSLLIEEADFTTCLSLRHVVTGGEAAPPDLPPRFYARLPHNRRPLRLYNRYGPTEATVAVTSWPCRADRRQTVPIGRPIAKAELYLLDRRLRPVPLGVTGELYLGGPSLARGYLRRPARTARSFVPHPWAGGGRPAGARLYRSGDLARYRHDGALLFVGRVDQQVKIRGFRVELGEIEAVLRRHPAVADAAVVDLEHGGSRRLAAYLVPAPGATSSIAALRAFTAQGLPDYMVPAAWTTLPRLPVLPTGKVDRKALPTPAWGEGEAIPDGPRTPDEEIVAEIWRAVLGVERVGRDEGFFALGGHSLLATKVMARLRQACGVDLPLRTLFETPTVRGLAAQVEAARRRARGLAPPPLEALPRDGELPLSYAQERLWFLDRLEPGSPWYTIPVAVRLRGKLHANALAASLNAIVARHEVLRTRFVARGGRPALAIQPRGSAPPASPPWTHIDLSTLPAARREAAAYRAAAAHLARPFDLARGPLLRTLLVRSGADAHLVVVALHHIVADGWSVGVLIRELATLYRAACADRPAGLPALPIQYADYAAWQRRWLSGPVLDEEIAHWRQILGVVPAVLDLPTDRPRPAVQTYRGAARWRPFPAALTTALRQRGQTQGATLYMTLLAGLGALLHRYTGQPKLAVGSPVANRERVETEGLIGVFLNTLVLTVDGSGDPSFETLLERVKAACLAAYSHQDLPFEKLVDALQPRRDLSHSPLFQVMLVLQNTPRSTLELPGLHLEPAAPASPPTAKFDLTLDVAEGSAGLLARLEYNRDLFDTTTAERLLRHLERLLEAATTAPERRLASLSLLGPAETQQLLVEMNDTTTSFATAEESLDVLLAARAATVPEAIAVSQGAVQVSYAALQARAGALAARLRQRGVGPEVRVGICLERSPELVVATLAVLAAGGAYVPLDPTHPGERLAFILADADARVLLTQRTLAQTRPAHQAHTVFVDEVGVDIDVGVDVGDAVTTRLPTTTIGAARLAYGMYTSGSTGQPKGVGISHRALVHLLHSIARRPGLGADDTLLAVTTPAFDIAGVELFLPLLVGARVAIAAAEAQVDGARLMAALATTRATVMQATPATWRLLLGMGWRGDGRLRMLCCGEALPEALAHALATAGGALWNLYGPTETTIFSAAGPVAAFDEDGGASLAMAASGAMGSSVDIGFPIHDTTLYITDRALHPLPRGVPGELVIGGAGVARGYLGRPRLTAARFVPDPFAGRPGARLYRSGDRVRHQARGALVFLGRFDQQVKIRGFRIELGEIEAALAAQPSVRQAVVAVREDRPGDQRLVAYLQPASGVTPASDALRDALRRTLPTYMVPAEVVYLEVFPLTPSGKVDRAALPAPEATAETTAEDALGSGPRTPTQQAVATVWHEVLARKTIGLDDNFFELGGHSLLLVQVHSRLRAHHGGLAVIDLFRHPTVRALAAFLDAARSPQPETATRSTAATAATARARAAARRQGADHQQDGIAIIGTFGRYPGAADLEAFWRNLRAGIDAIETIADDELRAAGLDDATLAHPDYVKARAVLADGDGFDAPFFGYTPREAQIMDPQQRVFLEAAWAALEDAGYDPSRTPGRVGVFAGVGLNHHQFNLVTYPALMRAVGRFQAFISNDKDFLPTRVSYKLNLQGPSINVQTACSTSLVAVCLACQSLLDHQADMALAGGVTVNTGEQLGYWREEGGIASPDGHTRAFDASAAGTLGSSGVGIVVLKRLADARADGDNVRAVIRGFALNNDGAHKVGFTAPSVEGQAAVIAEAQAMAGVDARSIGYVEAHGTATPLGDTIEVAALTQAFRAHTDDRAFCALGAVKSNIGHTDTAAGAAGLIKTVLALEHGELPPSLHCTAPNPEIDFAASPFYINTALRPWQREDGPRRAGVSSFGIGGTNAHLVVEEAPAPPPPTAARPWQLLLLSARTPSALDTASSRLAAHLQAHSDLGLDGPDLDGPGLDDLDLADTAYTLQVGRKAFPYRRMLVCRDAADAADALAPLDRARAVAAHHPGEAREVVFLFPGGGAQYPNMGRDLYRSEGVYRQQVDRCASLLVPHLGFDIRHTLYPAAEETDAAAARLRRTTYALPALFTTEYALARLWMSWGVQPAAMIGHSLGEYVAACLAETLSLDDALALVALRGRLFETLPQGAMLSVALPAAELEDHLGETLAIAAVNTPSLAVASGPTAAIGALEATLRAADVEVSPLHIEVAAHSPMVAPILAPFAELVQGLDLGTPTIPYVSNVTGTWITPAESTDAAYWPRHLRQTVRFAAGLDTLFAQPGRLFLEVGPGQTLSTLARQHPGFQAGAAGAITSLRHPRERSADNAYLLGALGRLWLGGVEVDWKGFHGAPRRRLPLPTYPFERQPFRLEARATPAPAADDTLPPLAAETPAAAGEEGLDERVAPRNPTEAKLATLWQELLGVAEIGVHDDFFALGGSSLLAVRLGTRLRRLFDCSLPPHFLLEAPTIAQLAARLSADGAAEEESEAARPSCLVSLQPGDGRRPLFFIHPVGGHVYFYQRLARRMDPARPVFGIQARGLEGDEEPFDHLEIMAAHYLDAVHSVQPKGPYLLGGSSMGGMIAFEMAQQLFARGERVDLLALLDTAGPGHMPHRPQGEAETLAYLLRDRLPISVADLEALEGEEQLGLIIAEATKAGALPPDLDVAAARRLLRVVQVHLGAMFGYQPTTYPGPIVFFRAQERRFWDPPHPERAWIDLAAEHIEIHPVPGDHLSMHHPPHVDTLVRKLERCLANLETP